MQKNRRDQIYRFIIASKVDRMLGYLGRHNMFISLVTRLAPPPEFYPQFLERKVRLRGVNFNVQMNDLMAWPIYFGLFMEEMEILSRIIPARGNIIDVGANIGRWSLFASDSKDGYGKKIFAFEPFPQTFGYLIKNLALNPRKNIDPINLALSTEKKIVDMGTASSTNSGMTKVVEYSQENSVSIQSVSLDEWISSHAIGKIDFIKIDVEGYEMRVLHGAKNTIRNDRPTILCEVNDQLLKKNGVDPKDIFDFLLQQNYKIKVMPDLNDINSLKSFENIHIDILAEPNQGARL